MNKPIEQQLEEQRLKVQAYREELSEKNEKVADLRVSVTMLSNRNEFLENENKELKRIAAVEAEGSTEAADPEDSNDSN